LSQPFHEEQQARGRSREIVAIVLLAAAVLVILSLYTHAAGNVGAALAHWLERYLGRSAVFPALFLLGLGWSLLSQRTRQGRGRRVTALFIIYIAALTGYHLVVTEIDGPLNEYWLTQVGEEGRGGGFVGAVLSVWALRAFGPWGSAVVLIAAALIGAVLYLETPISRLAAASVRLARRVLRGATLGLVDFVLDAVRRTREFFARLQDQRRRAQAERAARKAARKASRRPAPLASAGGAAREEAPPRREPARDAGKPVDDIPRWLEAPLAKARPETGNDAGKDGLSGAKSERVAGEAAAAAAEPGGRRSRRDEPVPAAGPGAAAAEAAERPVKEYVLPDPALLERPREPARGRRSQEADNQAQLLEETLATFGVQAKVVHVSRGPVITRYELQPAPGVKVSKIVGLADDLALALAAADVRIEAPVPGKSVVGIEVPNKEPSVVYFREVVESPEFQKNRSKLAVGLGKDIAGNPVIADLTKLLHVLIAGATGSGKSVCINTLICSILYRAQPHEVKLMMIDPKRVELAVYDGIPHLIAPVVTDPKLAANALRWAVREMEARYKKFSERGVRNIDGYNRGVESGAIEDEPMPYLVVIIDELADLMLVAQHDVEDSICRLAQMARAAGIHLVIATQRPSVDVITGLIKANVPSRIAFAVSSGVDSRTILDMIGAERLIGRGDMLYYPIGANKPLRAQGAWISDKEVQAIVNFWKRQGAPVYDEAVTEPAKGGGQIEEGDDELFEDAVRLVVETGNASISMLQRRFRIGYARAARLIDMMELQGIVGPYQGSKPREVLRTLDDLEKMAN